LASFHGLEDWGSVGREYRKLLLVSAVRAGHSGKVALEREAIRRELGAVKEYPSHFAAGHWACGRGASDEHTRQRSVRSERQSPRAQGPQPCGSPRRGGIRFVAPQSQRSRLCSFVAPRRCPHGAGDKVQRLFLDGP